MSAWHEQSASDYPPSDPSARLTVQDVFPPQPQPKTELARYRLLSPTAAVRVSPICLGAMSLGDQWTGFMAGKLDQKESEAYLDAFYEAGGNFVDTAGAYQDEQSEHIIGEWMEKRGNRHDMVIATKYTTYGKNRQHGPYPGIGVNYCGNSKKNLRLSVDESLKRLRSEYIDLLYVHCIPELMQSLNEMVRNGKVLYLGASDMPAWVVAQANEYARQNCLAQFVILAGGTSRQETWSGISFPCAGTTAWRLATPFAVLGQGKFKTPEELKAKASLRGGRQPTEKDIQVCQVLQEVADEIGGGVHLAHIGLAWARQMMTDCIPILGGTSIEQLKSNIEALKIVLTQPQLKKLNDAAPFDHGYPTGQFGLDPRLLPDQQPETSMLNTAGHVRYPGWP